MDRASRIVEGHPFVEGEPVQAADRDHRARDTRRGERRGRNEAAYSMIVSQ